LLVACCTGQTKELSCWLSLPVSGPPAVQQSARAHTSCLASDICMTKLQPTMVCACAWRPHQGWHTVTSERTAPSTMKCCKYLMHCTGSVSLGPIQMQTYWFRKLPASFSHVMHTYHRKSDACCSCSWDGQELPLWLLDVAVCTLKLSLRDLQSEATSRQHHVLA
jgi:hypothetical protein